MKFDMGAAWNEASAMMSANRELLIVLAGIFFLLPALVVALVGPTLPPMAFETMEDFERQSAILGDIYADWWWLFLLGLLVQVLGYLAILALLRDDSRPTVGSAIGGGVRALLPAIATYLVFSIGLSLAIGLLLLITTLTAGLGAIVTFPLMLVGSIYVAVKASLAAPIIAVEKVANPFTVLSRSWKLTKGNTLRLFLFFLLIAIAYVVISIVIGLVTAGIAALLGPEVGPLLATTISAILGAIATVVMIAALAAAHRQLAGPSHPAVGKTFE